MRRIVIAMTSILLAAPARAETPTKVDWFAFDVDLGGGGTLSPAKEGFFLGRVRVGYARVRGKLFSSIGAAVETRDLRAPTYGVAGELVSLRNLLAAHAAVMTSDLGDVTFELGAGWAGLRAEAQLTVSDGPTAVAVLGVVRLPLGAVAYELLRE